MAGELVTKIEDEQVRAIFNRLKQRTGAGGMRSALVSMGRYGKSSTQLRFRNQTDPDGARWRPSRRAIRDSGQTLRDTGRLRNSISWLVDAQGVAWGTNVEYGKTHQFGYYKARQRVRGYVRLVKQAFGKKLRFGVYARVAGFARKMRIVARPFLGVNDADRAALLAIMSDHLARSTEAR